jgi:hypothetical protein
MQFRTAFSALIAQEGIDTWSQLGPRNLPKEKGLESYLNPKLSDTAVVRYLCDPTTHHSLGLCQERPL